MKATKLEASLYKRNSYTGGRDANPHQGIFYARIEQRMNYKLGESSVMLYI
jgi:hypothetical protein